MIEREHVWVKNSDGMSCGLAGLPRNSYRMVAYDLLNENAEPCTIVFTGAAVTFAPGRPGHYLVSCWDMMAEREIANASVVLKPQARTYSVQLSLQAAAETGLDSADYRIRIVASNAVAMPSEIFLFRRNTDGVNFSDDLVTVCKPGDLEEFPVGSPRRGGQFFRGGVIDSVERSSAAAKLLWESVQAETGVLIAALERNRTLCLESAVTVGG